MKKYLVFLLLLNACHDISDVRVTFPINVSFAAHAPSLQHGQDILGLAMQDMTLIKQNLSPGQCIGVMDGTFGNAKINLEALLATGKVPCFRSHIGGFCKHGASCGSGECKQTDLTCLKRRAFATNVLAARYPTVTCYASPWAEYSETSKTRVDQWFRIIREAAPLCVPVASAYGGYVPPNVLIERHGNNPPVSDITSNDGVNYFDSDSVKYNGIATLVSFKWTNRYNLRLTSEKGIPLSPKKRPLTNRIGKSDFLAIQIMANELPAKPAPPSVCKTVTSFAGKDLYKPHSEDYGYGDRSNKPLLISRSRTPRMDILAPSGKVIGCLKYYGKYVDEGYFRHYVGSCSGDDSYSLYKKSGEWAFIKNGTACRPITVLRRMGYFR